MSTHAATRSRTGGRRRRAGARRRVALLVVAGLAAVLAVTGLPTLRHAAKEITLPLRHEDIIRQQAAQKGLDPALIAAVIYTESKFTDSTSRAGAQGLMQLTPQTAQGIATRTGGVAFRAADLSDPQVNISYGSWYLRHLLGHYDGDEVAALAAYNGGMGNADRWVAAAKARGESLGPGGIPFGETRAYVRKVMAAQRRYRSEYRRELGL
jgi:soluble lytic murein transglycosylase